MKRLFFIVLAVSLLASCSIPAKLVNTATFVESTANQPISAVFADLEVSPTKITYFMLPSKTVLAAGEDNVVKTAVREALIANGNADVLVCMNKQIKYDTKGQIESITVTGYPATYTNFRSAGDEYYKGLKPSDMPEPDEDKAVGLGSLFKKK